MQQRLRTAMAVEQPTSAAGYDNMRGTQRMRTAMAAHMQRVLAPTAPPGTVDPDHLCISVGCGAIIDNLAFSICGPGDGVLIPAPYYPAFDNDLRVRCQVRSIPVSGAAAHLLPTPAVLDAALHAAAAEGCTVRALLLTNPSNPLGVVYPPADMAALITWAISAGLHVIVDEVYASSVFAADPAVEFVSAIAVESTLPGLMEDAMAVSVADQLHVVYGLSKDFCVSGYRVGVLRTRNKGVLQAMDNIGYFCAVPGRGGVENKDSTDVESPPSSARLYEHSL